MNTLKTSLLFGLACVFSSSAVADDHHAHTAKYKVTPVSNNIVMLQGKGGNLALLTGDQGTLLVDDDYQVMSAALKNKLTEYGGTDKLTYIINTHWHGDHTEGNKALGQHAQIVAHDNVRKRLLTRQEVKLFKMVSEPYPEQALPSITYQQQMSLHINGEEVQLVHYANGHTDSDSVVYFKNANVVHLGDHFFSGFFPFVDVDNGGNVLTMAKNIALVLQRIDNNTKVIPGHGPLSTKADLQAFYEMLVGTAEEVAKLKASGKSLTQAQKAGLSSKWDEWTDGFLTTETWISLVYKSL